MTGTSDGHRNRLRQRFLNGGLAGFLDYEIIELLLTLGTPRKDCKEAAKEAVATFRTLSGVLEADPAALSRIRGIGPANQMGIQLIRAVAERYFEEKATTADPITDSKALFDFLYFRFQGKKQECFIGVFLDSKNRPIKTEVLFEGSLTASAVYIRDIIKKTLDYHAAAVFFAHNHPSGDPAPSLADMAVTRQIMYACRIMGLTLFDHIIIGRNQYYSFADQGHLRRFTVDYDALTQSASHS